MGGNADVVIFAPGQLQANLQHFLKPRIATTQNPFFFLFPRWEKIKKPKNIQRRGFFNVKKSILYIILN